MISLIHLSIPGQRLGWAQDSSTPQERFPRVVYDIVTIDGVYQTSKIHPHRIQLNESDLKTIASGMPLELEEGYDLVLHSVDIDGNKARLDLRKGRKSLIPS